MKSVLQRVSHASVTVDGTCVGQIGTGLLVLFGVEKGDTEAKLDYHVKKLWNLRVFEDEAGKMNRSVQDIQGSLLIVSQFTLAGDCRQGNRPGFDQAMRPAQAEMLYLELIRRLRAVNPQHPVETGQFGAHMRISLTNEGPVTFILEN